MNELAYLGLAVLISTIGSFFVWFRRGRPQSFESGVDQFARGLQVLERQSAQREERRPV